MSDASTSYLSLAAPCPTEYVLQRSRFIGCAAPCRSVHDFRAFLRATASSFPGATNCCSAYRLGFPDQPRVYQSETGEPSGSAGAPFLAALTHPKLCGVALVVTRYFSAIRLGSRTLHAAYAHIARLTLSRAALVRRLPTTARSFLMSYPAFYILDALVKKIRGWYSGTSFRAHVVATAHVTRKATPSSENTARVAGASRAHTPPPWQNE